MTEHQPPWIPGELGSSIVGGASLLVAIIAALDANAALAWAGAACAAGALIWSMVRNQRRLDRESARRQTWEDAFQAEQLARLRTGQPPLNPNQWPAPDDK